MKFAKYEGLGNDFIIVDSEDESIDPARAAELCDRHTGIGADGVLINTSRGRLIDEAALCDLLEASALRGVALDVVAEERSDHSRRLTELAATRDDVIVTPHIGGATHESMARTERFMAEKLRRWILEHRQPGEE